MHLSMSAKPVQMNLKPNQMHSKLHSKLHSVKISLPKMGNAKLFMKSVSIKQGKNCWLPWQKAVSICWMAVSTPTSMAYCLIWSLSGAPTWTIYHNLSMSPTLASTSTCCTAKNLPALEVSTICPSTAPSFLNSATKKQLL